jgi:hypothetical protein
VTPFNSPSAPLDAAGNFLIRGKLDGTPPNPCGSAVLLVRTEVAATATAPARPGAWFAAGISSRDDNDDN